MYIVRENQEPEFQVKCKCGALLNYDDSDIYEFRECRVICCPRCRTQIAHRDSYQIEKNGG